MLTKPEWSDKLPEYVAPHLRNMIRLPEGEAVQSESTRILRRAFGVADYWRGRIVPRDALPAAVAAIWSKSGVDAPSSVVAAVKKHPGRVQDLQSFLHSSSAVTKFIMRCLTASLDLKLAATCYSVNWLSSNTLVTT